LNDAIVESEERLRYVVKASREMVWDMDVTTGTVNWNTGGENLFGYFPNQVENTLDWWSQKLHPEEKEKVLEGFNDFLASKEESWHSEYRFANGDGGYTWVADNGCALRDADGKAYRVIGSIMDISQLHKVQDDLLLSKKLIEESEKLKSSLLDNINHELRTPMNGILGFADLLVNQVEKPEAKIMVDNILYSGRRLLNTLKSIMDVAQLASGKYPVHLSLNDLSVIIQDRLHHYTKMAEEKGLSIITNIDNSVIANVDAPGLVNVLDHLVNNAVKFTLKGWVEISTNYVKSDNKSLPSISVKDTGIGITPDKQKIIFQDFRQASEGKDRSYQGTGLGLTIVQRIMELLNSEITLNSEPGIGSTFTLIFPSVPSSQKIAGPLGPPEVSVPQPKLEEILSEEYKVLIVEDDKVNAELTSFYLEGVATVDIAYDGESAVRMAEHNKYSAILMDINLGVGMDGFEATKRIRQLQGYKHIPIIATTGYTLYNEIELIKNSGFTEYLPKPFSKKELMTSIKRNSLINQY
ncbi:MAG: ATP-binding protein, partial [Bacteroidota bacterium]|nr:ATP-binding protein [Bacteroidota bacterium]